MIIRRLEAGSAPAGFAAFERGFTYPFGPGRRFRIDHGPDTLRFFRANGPALRFTAEADGAVLGTLAASMRRLRAPCGSEVAAAYLGDLKVSPGARGGPTLARLAHAAITALSGVKAAFAVVMDTTEPTPERYTGRAGLPAMTALARIVILRIEGAEPEAWKQDEGAQARCDWRRLSLGRYGSCGGRAALRSLLPPTWLRLPDGSAAGRLEDTLRGKRLFWEDGSEMRNAHLGRFAYADPAAAAALLRAAARRAAGAGLPALLAAVPEHDASAVQGRLTGLSVSAAPATVYGIGLELGHDWNIDTAEV